MHFSVVIIGAGPAGTSAAMTLASNNIDVCIIDKKEFPRDKLCGGLLTKRTKTLFERIFNEGWEDIVVDQASGVAFFNRHTFISKVTHYSTLYFTRRTLFDDYLLQKATAQGAVAMTGKGVKALNLAENLITLENGQTLSYDYLIGADGVNSFVAKTLFEMAYDKDTIGFALECEIPVSDTIAAVDVPEIYFNIIPWGYVWVFPKKETLTVGIGGIHRYNHDMRSVFETFLQKRFSKEMTPPIKGHFIPFGDFRKKVVHNNVFLCGDAAGLVETITGEGIAFALQSGHNAAQSIIQKSRDASLDMERLYTNYHKEITSILKISNILRPLIFARKLTPLFVKVLAKSETLPKKHMDLMADEITYPQYFNYILKKILLKPFKRFSKLYRKEP